MIEIDFSNVESGLMLERNHHICGFNEHFEDKFKELFFAADERLLSN